MWTMNQWAMGPRREDMEKVLKAQGYEPDAWSFSKPLFNEGKRQPSEEELVEMARLAIAGDVPSPRKPRGRPRKKKK